MIVNLTTFTLIHTPDQPRGHPVGTGRGGRTHGSDPARRLDRALPGDHRPDQHHRIRLSLYPAVAVAGHRDHLPDCAGSGDPGPLPKHLEGSWRGGYVIGSVVVLYLNVFVLVDQLFKRIPALIVLAPAHMEPPYLVTQLIVLALFGVLGVAAFRCFRPQPVPLERGVRVPAAVPNR